MNFNFYAYSGSVARSNDLILEVKDLKTGQWKEVKDPLLWKRIHDEGMKISEKEAEELYQLLKKKYPQN